jgi:hypothetical protein
MNADMRRPAAISARVKAGGELLARGRQQRRSFVRGRRHFR